jgi:hypothetical protein
VIAPPVAVVAPPVAVIAPPPVAVVPPTGYVLDPSDARKPIYVVNQGPVLAGPHVYAVPLYTAPGLLAVPTYSEGGYAYAYPYVKSYWSDWWSRPPRRPYFRSSRDVPPYGIGPPGPYEAYRYRPAPRARVIRVPPRIEHTSVAKR